LKKYGIAPKQVRVEDWSGKGYAREDLHDTWQRYLHPLELRTEARGNRETFGPLGTPPYGGETRETSVTTGGAEDSNNEDHA